MNKSRANMVIFYRSTLVYIFSKNTYVGAGAGVREQERARVRVRAGVPLPSLRAPANSSLTVSEKLRFELWQVYRPAVLIGCMIFEGKELLHLNGLADLFSLEFLKL